MVFPVGFVSRNSEYKQHPGFDAYDTERCASNVPDLTPAAFHPPCRLFSKMRGLSTAPASERSLAYFAVTHVQCFGGVVEHPCFSKLWSDMSLPAPGIIPDLHGGFTLSVNLHWFGFPARKHTWLYIVGCKPSDVPAYPLNFDAVTHLVAHNRSSSMPYLEKEARSWSPPAFVEWVYQLLMVIHSKQCL